MTKKLKRKNKGKQMKEMKVLSLLLNLTLCLMIVVGVHSNASAITAIATVGTNTSAPNVFYTGGCGGNFTLTTNNAFIRSKVGFGFNPNVTVTFGPMVGLCATYQMSPNNIWRRPERKPGSVFRNRQYQREYSAARHFRQNDPARSVGKQLAGFDSVAGQRDL
jgi:hypothetical protein